jgi:hypothetical protein
VGHSSRVPNSHQWCLNPSCVHWYTWMCSIWLVSAAYNICPIWVKVIGVESDYLRGYLNRYMRTNRETYRIRSIPCHSSQWICQKAPKNAIAFCCCKLMMSEPRVSDRDCWINGLSDIQKPIHWKKENQLKVMQSVISFTSLQRTVEKTLPELEKVLFA